MTKFFVIISFLYPVSEVLAHVGEKVEEHAEEIAGAGPPIYSLIIGGILVAAVLGFFVWVMVKK